MAGPLSAYDPSLRGRVSVRACVRLSGFMRRRAHRRRLARRRSGRRGSGRRRHTRRPRSRCSAGLRDAIGDGPVLHAIVREQITGGQRYDVATGRTRPVTSEYESWIDPERDRLHAVQRSGGEVVSDELTGLDDFGPSRRRPPRWSPITDGGSRRASCVSRERARSAAGGCDWLASTDRGRRASRPSRPPSTPRRGRLLRLRTIARYFQTSRDFEQLESVDREDADFAVRFGPRPPVRQTRPEGRRVTPARGRPRSSAERSGRASGPAAYRFARCEPPTGGLAPTGR